MKKTYLIILLSLVVLPCSWAQNSAFEKKEFVFKTDTLAYRILFPENYSPTEKYPLFIFLHGSGERGSDNEKQLMHGASVFLSAEARTKYPSIVIFPQCPEKGFWAPVNRSKDAFSYLNSKKPTEPMALLIRLIRETIKNEQVDKSRVYVSGLSMGGMGTFDLICRKPGLFAAAAPICGGVSVERLKKVKDMPIRIFHGTADNAVPVQHSKDAYNELKAKGAQKAEIILFDGVGHNSWDYAFKQNDFLEWFYKKSK
jgi:predicted peptidase